jgi:Asp-tRNA(Asn)/Glu-tRNA(Gln) amidotransferase A subunit family amidase
VPFSKTVDHVGFFTQDVQGAGLAASILCRKWNGSAHVEQPAFCVPEGPYLEKADSEGLSGFRETCRIIEAAGFRILRVGAMPDFEAIVRHHLRLIARDAYDVHRTWYAKYGALCREQTRDLFETGKGVGDDELAASRESCRQLRVELTGLLDRTAGCAFLSPSSVGPAPRGISSTGDPLMNLPWTHAGLPVVSLPSGVSASGLPLGLQLTGRFMEDETLMHCARLVSDVLSRESVASSPGLEAVPDDERQ